MTVLHRAHNVTDRRVDDPVGVRCYKGLCAGVHVGLEGRTKAHFFNPAPLLVLSFDAEHGHNNCYLLVAVNHLRVGKPLFLPWDHFLV